MLTLNFSGPSWPSQGQVYVRRKENVLVGVLQHSAWRKTFSFKDSISIPLVRMFIKTIKLVRFLRCKCSEDRSGEIIWLAAAEMSVLDPYGWLRDEMFSERPASSLTFWFPRQLMQFGILLLMPRWCLHFWQQYPNDFMLNLHYTLIFSLHYVIASLWC